MEYVFSLPVNGDLYFSLQSLPPVLSTHKNRPIPSKSLYPFSFAFAPFTCLSFRGRIFNKIRELYLDKDIFTKNDISIFGLAKYLFMFNGYVMRGNEDLYYDISTFKEITIYDLLDEKEINYSKL